MSMEFSSQNIEFIKEFAHDGLDILKDVSDGLMVLNNHHEQSKPVTDRTYRGMVRQLSGIVNSAVFLGVASVRQVVQPIGDFLEQLPKQEYLFSRHEIDVLNNAVNLVQSLLERIQEEDLSACQELDALVIAEIVRNLHANPQVEASDPVPQPEYPPLPADFNIMISPEMLAVFLAEAEEHLEQTEASLLGLEKNFKDRELLDTAFRGIHTFKGNSGLFNYTHLEKIGHEFESILDQYRSGTLAVDSNGISLMLKVLDLFKSAVHKLPEGEGKIEQFEDVLAMLREYLEKRTKKPSHRSQDKAMLGEILLEMGEVSQEQLDAELERQSLPLGKLLLDSGSISPENLESALRLQGERRIANPQTEPSKKVSSAQNIRVDLFKLDTLMNLVGELIIAENTVCHNPDLEGYDFQNFKKAALQLNRISRELQEISLSLRMVPIEATFHRMVRVVRDISHKQSKQVELVLEGEETEIDKTVVESLASPLLHIIRNAIDHGIETPEERDRLGKPPKGTIKMRAYHDGGEVVIEIRDDGKGMDPEKILAKARDRGLVARDQEMTSRQEILDLIFLPGFSTAEFLTDISGRGVGMDVVKKNIESIKGRVQIGSVLGQGSAFTIRIPLTLAIIEGMLTRVGQQLFTIPMLSIRESLRTEQHQLSKTIDGGEVVRIRNRLVPILRLHRLFSIEPDFLDLTEGILVIVDHEQMQFCLFADEILGQYQTVIKGLSPFLGGVRGISGTSIMSNGDISLILDIQSLIELTGAKMGTALQVDEEKKWQ